MLNGKGSEECVAFRPGHAGTLDEHRDRWVAKLKGLERVVEILIRGKINEAVAAPALHQSSDRHHDVAGRFRPALEMGLDAVLNQHRQIYRRKWRGQLQHGSFRLAAAVKSYFQECFTKSSYLWVFAFIALGNLAFVPVNTYMISAAKDYGMNMETYGKYFVVMFICSFVLAYPLGWLADRFHPLRVGAAAAGYAVATFLGFLLIHNAQTFGVALLAHGILSGCYYTGTVAVGQMVFPKLKFAQFAAAVGMVNSLMQIVMGPLLGSYLDLLGNQYRYAFLTGSLISSATLGAGFVLLRRHADRSAEFALSKELTVPLVGPAEESMKPVCVPETA
jgi:hypothetical protein